MRRAVFCAAVLFAAVFLVPSESVAQGSIAGVAKDGTGALMPGVTVEASSPALIEKTRTAVTDGSGQYRIVDLPPGMYRVTFTLTGFRTVVRQDIQLQGSFAAQVNADLQIGAIEETLTVTGATPTVDVINNQSTVVLDRELLDAIPTTVRNLPMRAALIPGSSVTFITLGQYAMTIHGSSFEDTQLAVDGMKINTLCGQGQYSGFYLNDAAAQEITYTTGAESAEVGAGGMRINVTPKDGGNRFSGSFFAQGASGPLQADNRSDEVKPFLAVPPGINYEYQINPSFGGPIKRDSIWFYLSARYNGYERYSAGAVFPDGSPVGTKPMQGNHSIITRLTWQATQANKFRLYLDRQYNGEDYNNVGFAFGIVTEPEAAQQAFGGGWTPQVKWTSTPTSRLLIDAGITLYTLPYEVAYQDSVGPRDLPNFEISTNRLTVATTNPYTSWTDNYGTAASVSYVTGTHAIKTGMTYGWGTNSLTRSANAEIQSLNFNLGVPTAVTIRNTPYTAMQEVKADFGAYVQDAWTMKRLTLNYGARFDHFNSEVPAHHSDPTPWLSFVRDFPAIKDVPNWNDWAIRLAGSYDLFGTGKTALKANLSKYVASEAASYAATFNPMSGVTENRIWNDADGNIQYNEVIGGSANFGQFTGSLRPDPDLERGYNWEYSLSVQHELMPKVSVTGGYYRRRFGNLRINDNLNLTPSDWNTFNIVGPSDPRFPTGGGEAITMYSLNQNKFGAATDTMVTFSTVNNNIYNGFEVSGNARFTRGFFFAGLTTQRSETLGCDGNTSTTQHNPRDNPNGDRFCDNVPPFRTLFKGGASYTIPWDVQLSGSFRATPGTSVSATYPVNAAIAGRPIIPGVSGGTIINVNLIEPNTLFLDYQKQLDARVGKSFRFGRFQAQGFMDVFNVLNAGTVTSVNTAYGANPATRVWMNPTNILTGRTVRFGTQWTF
jgi:Carboxypeptidase regulatory-like domain